MNSSPSANLKVTRRASSTRGIMVTSSCSTCTHSTGPIPSGKTKRSGSENGGRVEEAALPLPHDGRVEALLDGRPDREHGGERVAFDAQVAARADVDLVDLVEQVL